MSRRAFESFPPVGAIGPYDVVGRLAAGGMAEVFLARERDGERRWVVIKRVLPHVAADPAHVASLREEARILLRLSHPALCRIHALGEDGDTLYLSMEWVDGVDLRALAQRAEARGGLPPVLAARIAAEVASALHHAHVAVDDDGSPLRVIHGDVTPENILLSFDGRVKLLDFGVAKATNPTARQRHGELRGKFAYMSPEQYHSLPLDARSDVFSLGICAYESLTGAPLFDRGDEFQTAAAVLFDQAPPSLRSVRPDVPEELDAIFLRALAKKREERFASAEALEHALRRFVRRAQATEDVPELADYVTSLFPERAKAGPSLDRGPLRRRGASGDATPTPVTSRETADPADDASARRELRLRVLVAFAFVLALALGLVARARRHEVPRDEPRAADSANR